jgi:hypothetical protein
VLELQELIEEGQNDPDTAIYRYWAAMMYFMCEAEGILHNTEPAVVGDNLEAAVDELLRQYNRISSLSHTSNQYSPEEIRLVRGHQAAVALGGYLRDYDPRKYKAMKQQTFDFTDDVEATTAAQAAILTAEVSTDQQPTTLDDCTVPVDLNLADIVRKLMLKKASPFKGTQIDFVDLLIDNKLGHVPIQTMKDAWQLAHSLALVTTPPINFTGDQ